LRKFLVIASFILLNTLFVNASVSSRDAQNSCQLTTNNKQLLFDTLPAGADLKLLQVIEGDIINFTVDNLGNIYLINSQYQLKKLNEKGDSVGVFNEVRRYGNLTYIDATNPLKLLLYFQDFATVVVLDRVLNKRYTFDLRQQNIMQARAISQSFDNGIWVYDEVEAKLKRLDDNGNVVDNSSDFRVLFSTPPTPVDIEDHDKLVYLYDPKQGLYIFDYYGSLKNKIALLGWEDFQVIDKTVFGRKGNVLEKYETGTLMLNEQAFPAVLTNVEKCRISVNKLYCLSGGKVYVYEL